MITSLGINTPSVGHFGNKLFIIATALALAKRNNDEVILPTYENTNDWKYGHVFKNKIKTLPIEKIKIENVYQEQGYHYTPIEYKPNMELKGYFQSEKYFEDCKDLIREYFEPTDEIKERISSDFLFDINITSIHIRRGDYLNHQNHYVQLWNTDYYYNAIQHFENLKNTDCYLIFSDDMIWCKNYFKGSKFLFCEKGKIEDFFTMSMCKNNIIGNSSYSWWSSWLNGNKNKIIVAPKKWFGPAYANWNENDNRPKEWILI